MDPTQFRSEIYVDDPLLAAVGSQDRRTKIFTMALLALEVLGFPLAWAKGSLGKSIVWIGAQFTTLQPASAGIRVSIPEDKMLTLRELVDDFRKTTGRSGQLMTSWGIS